MKENMAFTIIEMLAVIAIMLILIGIGVPAYVSWSNRSKIERARAVIRQLEMALEMYRSDYGTYPDWWQELNNPSDPRLRQYLDQYMRFDHNDLGSGNPPVRDPNGNILLDPWGNYYIVLVDNDDDPSTGPENFFHNKNSCYIYSYGPDGRESRNPNYGGDDADNIDNFRQM